MRKFLDYLRNTNDKYNDILITNIEYCVDDNVLEFKVQYVCDNFSDADKLALEKDIRSYIDADTTIDIKCRKYFIDKDIIKDYVVRYIQDKYPSVSNDELEKNVAINLTEDNVYQISLVLGVESLAHLTKNDFENEIVDYLQMVTMEEYEIILIADTSESADAQSILDERYSLLNNSDMLKRIDYEPIEVSGLEKIIGDIDIDYVYPIATLSEGKVACVGEVAFYKVSEYESRFKNKDGSAKIGKRVTFVLRDGSDKISCTYFPTFADSEKVDAINNGDKIAVVGELSDDENRGRNLRVRSIAKCDFIAFKEPEKVIELKTVNAEYKHIFPKSYEHKTQSDFLKEAENIDTYLMDNTVVVFDLETTGLNVNECEIIEIGAVKMVAGQIVETFDTLIKPKEPIPEDATKVNNITNEMVANCMSIDQVFPDFYKFIDGAVIVAYNIEYDYNVLKAYGDRNGYVISNRQVDALKLAKRALPQYKSHKLGKVVKVLGIQLDNAHRALFDTIATAEVLKSCLNMLSDEDKKQLLS
ncbi:MAG: hypothetical protein E7361_02435 [Clostridiales bacterium]|nr:hypothetical protein [Clostridiales bacterium]